ncbi:MAG: primosomal protein N' [Armatimonadetes bacterium]|nr:primosomal protein N' [Armatimonadota bacterium]
MSPKILVADIGIDSKSAGVHAVYTYSATADTRIGEAYFVPLGPRRVLGFVVRLRETPPSELGFAEKLLKPLGPKIDGLTLPESSIALAHEVARQTLSPLPMAIGLISPPGIRDRLVTVWQPASTKKPDEALTPAQSEALATLVDAGELEDSPRKPLPRGSRNALRALERRGLVVRGMSVSMGGPGKRVQGMLRLTADSDKIEKFLKGPGKKRPAQSVTLMRLQGSEAAAFSIAEIKALGGVSDQTIKALIEGGLLDRVESEPGLAAPPPTPNKDQAVAIKAVTKAIKDGSFERFLLYGVTGSGKTEVYLRAAAEALQRGKQVLYLVPEIALTAQVIAQLRERFGKSVAVLHSNMSPLDRLESWMRVRSGEAPVILGARSALFAPLTNLGLIIVDEEHEASYKQENAPRYHSHRLAEFLAREFSAPVLFGSATPSIESYAAAEAGDYKLLRLPKRAASAKLPNVHIEDLTDLYRDHRLSIFTDSLRDGIEKRLAKKEQVILFLNRRAYAPFLMCRDCAHRFVCTRCAVSLKYHRHDRKLRCHHCGYFEVAPDSCPECEGNRVAPFGIGGEKVEEAVKTEFPNAVVARLDRDVARRRGALEEILAKFRSGEIDVLVGTQMVAKGLDFPNVTLVGVIAADTSLSIPDFRASERTFQLLSQVAGRAGRGQSPGEVVIQTMNPDHVAVLCARDHDFESFYKVILEERREAHYPPFYRLVNVQFAGSTRHDVVAVAADAGERLKAALPEVELLGPTECAIAKIKNEWRRHLLIKLSKDANVLPIAEALEGLDKQSVRVHIDVDPNSMM